MFDLIPGAAGLDPQPIPEVETVNLAKALLAQGAERHQRRILLLAGEQEWCRKQAQAILSLPELGRVTWVSAEAILGIEVVNARTAKELLGQERDVVIFDAHTGFDPDAFGAVSGIICGGGLFILLTPPLQEWEKRADPACERIAISPLTYKDIGGRFIRRLVNVIPRSSGVCVVEQHSPIPSIEPEKISSGENKPGDIKDDVFRTEDQKVAVEAIEHVVHGHRRRPAVLVSDRGRGKTAALGIAAARLIKEAANRTDHAKGFMHIIVTSPQRSAVEALFFHAQQLLPGADRSDNRLLWEKSHIQYRAPDALCDSLEPADLVLVDEAAAIPASMLTRMLEKYSRIVFSTTVHGYEGTGRGFAIRFRETLDKRTPGWSEVFLTQPIRWSVNDPLEQLVFRSLLLDAESTEDQAVLGATHENVVIECIDRDELVRDENTLSQIFGLLVSAHYQTSPNDLRNLLDGPGISVYVMCTEDKAHVVATALVSTEGEFSDELTDAILSGQRRPRGHLMPQSLVTHMGIRQAAPLRCARIMRIAVHPVAQRKGLGSELCRFIKSETERDGFHLIGTSFGATPELLRFWKAQDMLPARVGFRRDHASGEYSVMMLMSLDKENNKGAEVANLARERFCEDLPHWMSDPLRDLDSAVLMELLSGADYQHDVTAHDVQMLSGFVKGARNYEDCSAEIWRLCLYVMSWGFCPPHNKEATVLVAKVLQKRTWKEVISLAEVSGRSDVVVMLRSAVSKCLEQYEKSGKE